MVEYGRSSALGKLRTDVEANVGIGGMIRLNKRINTYAMFSKIRNSDGKFNEIHVGFQFTSDPNPGRDKYDNFFGPKKEALHGVLLNPPN